MNLRNIIIAVVVIAIVAVGGYFGYLYYIGSSDNTSQDIEEVAEQIEDAGEGTLFRIVSDESEASFTLDEDLAGVRTTVVGTTSQVGGDIIFNFTTPAESEVGTITINARSLQTDNNFRNGALQDRILRSRQDEYEFITFVPTALNGLPETITVGETYTFDIVGDLTVIDATNEVTFNAEVTVVSETEISGTATTTIAYGDWDIPVPTAPSVANVEEEVDLAISFVAREVDESAAAEATEE